MSEFGCTSCGKCCASVGIVVNKAKEQVIKGDASDLTKEVANFPFKYDDNGMCEKLGEDNKCMVYATRPDVCNVDKMWSKYTDFISKKEYYQIAEQMCKKLQDGL